MKSLLKVIGITALIGGLLGAGLLLSKRISEPAVQQAQSFGSFTPVGGQTYTLAGAGINSSASSITLNSFQTPDGRLLTMSMFGSIGYAVIDPNSPSRIEDITFTGISQNSNGTAVLTGVSRGMDFVTPYTASSTLAYSHAGGSYLILSNTAGFYGQQFLFSNSVSTSTATLVFASTSPPRYDGTTDFSGNSLFLIDRAYVDALTIQGSPTSTFSGMGQIRLATNLQVASSTASSTDLGGQPLTISSKFSTTTPGTQCNSGAWNCVPVAYVSGKLSQLWLDLTANFAWTGTHTWTGTSGKIGIGTSTPYAVLSVVSNAPAVFGTIYATSTAAGNATSTFDGNISVGGNASTTNLYVGGYASIGLLSTTSATITGPTGNGVTTSGIAYCPAGYSVTGGGATLSGTNAGAILYISAPNGTTNWTASVICSVGGGSCSANTFTVTAMCARIK